MKRPDLRLVLAETRGEADFVHEALNGLETLFGAQDQEVLPNHQVAALLRMVALGVKEAVELAER